MKLSVKFNSVTELSEFVDRLNKEAGNGQDFMGPKFQAELTIDYITPTFNPVCTNPLYEANKPHNLLTNLLKKIEAA